MAGTRAFLFTLVLAACAGGCRQSPPPTATPSPLPTAPPPAAGPLLTPAPAGVWQSYGAAEGLPSSNVTAVAAGPQGDIWIGTPRGAAHFDGQRWRAYDQRHGLISDVVLEVAVDERGTAWFGTDRGLARFDGQTWTHYEQGVTLPQGYVQALELDQNGRLWLGFTGAGADWAFGNGVARLDDGGTADTADDRWQFYPPTRQRMSGDIPSAVADMGPAGVWFAMTSDGVVRPPSGRGGVWQLFGAETPGRDDDVWLATLAGLPSRNVTALTPGRVGDLWIGTTAGLLHLPAAAVASFDLEQGRHYGREEGLPSNLIMAVAIAADGRVWAGTDQGVVLLENGRIEVATTADGLADNRVRDIAIGDDGSLWLATPSGVSMRR